MRAAAIVGLLLLAGCASTTGTDDPAEATGMVHGWVLDHTLAPIPDAQVRVSGLGQAVTDQDGHFEVRGNLTRDEYVVVAEAPGYTPASSVVEAGRVDQAVQVRLQLDPVPATGYTRLETYQGLIACEVVAQVGHSHGTGNPEEDDRYSCLVEFDEERAYTFGTESNPTDMLIEAIWRPSTPKAEYLTFALFDDEDEVMVFAEGSSILRIEIGRLIVQDYFGAGREATLRAYTGIPEDDPTEVFVGLSVDQEFEVYLTTFYGQDMPRGYSVA